MNEKSIRIAVLGTRGIPDVMGGVETHCQALYPRLVAKGYKVTLFARKGYVATGRPYEYEGVEVEPLWAPRKKSIEAILHTAGGILRVALRRHEFDLLHIHAIGPALLLPFARMLGLKVVFTHHGPDYDRRKWGRFAKAVLRIGERFGCRYSHAVITVSRHIRGQIKNLFNCDGNYIPNGVTLPDLLPAGDLLARLGLQSKKYILAVGRLVPEKGFHDLIAAFKGIDTDWKLVIAGAADHEDGYSRDLREMAASDGRIIMSGFIKGQELGEIFSNAGLFVLPSYHEGLPIALLEAFSYDLPIVASDIPANKELTYLDETFPVGNVDALKEKIETFFSGSTCRSHRRNRIKNEYNWDLVADQTESVYMAQLRSIN